MKLVILSLLLSSTAFANPFERFIGEYSVSEKSCDTTNSIDSYPGTLKFLSDVSLKRNEDDNLELSPKNTYNRKETISFLVERSVKKFNIVFTDTYCC